MQKVVISCRAALKDGRNSRSILKLVELEAEVVAIFRGAGKESAFEDWIKTNYPGFVYAPHSGAIKQPADVGLDKPRNKTKKTVQKPIGAQENDKSKNSNFSIKSFLPTFSSNKGANKQSLNESIDKPSRKVRRLQNKIETAELKEDLRQVKRLSRENKLNELNETAGQDGKSLNYYLQFLWIYLDSPWKKGLLILSIMAVFSSGYQFVRDKINYTKDYELFRQENFRLEKAVAKIDSLLLIDKEKAVEALKTLDWSFINNNRLLSDSIKNRQKYWRKIKGSIKI